MAGGAPVRRSSNGTLKIIEGEYLIKETKKKQTKKTNKQTTQRKKPFDIPRPRFFVVISFIFFHFFVFFLVKKKGRNFGVRC